MDKRENTTAMQALRADLEYLQKMYQRPGWIGFVVIENKDDPDIVDFKVLIAIPGDFENFLKITVPTKANLWMTTDGDFNGMFAYIAKSILKAAEREFMKFAETHPPAADDSGWIVALRSPSLSGRDATHWTTLPPEASL